MDFYGTHFGDAATFTKATFDSIADFCTAGFASIANFPMVRFCGSAGFHMALFDSNASFFWTVFSDTARFAGSQFRGLGEFRGAVFDSVADFSDVSFSEPARFFRSQFNSIAVFSNARFDSETDFSQAVFKSRADFRCARFHGVASFDYTVMPESLDFRGVRILGPPLDLSSALPTLTGDTCLIALTGTDISKFKLRMGLFKLWFPDEPLPRVRVDGADTLVDTLIGPTYDQKASVYESVLKKLKDDGFTKSYQTLDIEYRRFKAEHQGGFDWYFLDTWNDWWWNYGYTKELIILWAIGLWIFFSCVNIFFFPVLHTRVYEISFLEQRTRRVVTGKLFRLLHAFRIVKWAEVMIFRIRYIFQVMTYTAVVFFGLKMSVDKFSKGVVRRHPWLFCYLMVVYLAGLVCLGFIANMVFTR